MPLLALDIGGANLKAADGLGFVKSVAFPLWQRPNELSVVLEQLIGAAPRAEALVATMTGELADCFETKSQGVQAIISALTAAADGRSVRIYLTDGSLVPSDEAVSRPLEAAASNWHALTRFAARFVGAGKALLFDVGSTTCDIIPIVDGQPAAVGRTDPERLAAGELFYTGVTRSPVCAVAQNIPWRGQQCPSAHELFATTRDAYLVLGELPEDPAATDTADGRPATRAGARDRLARSICADREMFDENDALAAAEAIRSAQAARLALAVRSVLARMKEKPGTIVISGQGEFLARHVTERLRLGCQIVSLAEQLRPEVSQCAPAHALAILAREQDELQ